MEPTKPSLELLRQLSDRHVLAALLDEPALTRAQIASRSGLSKPTVGESVRRLVGVGTVRDTGGVTTGRGRAGTLYALADDLGVALAVGIAPDGVRAEAIDVRGREVASAVRDVPGPTTPGAVGAALVDVAVQVGEAAGMPARLAVVSAADPVDRRTGRLVSLPDAPFLVGELDPVALLGPLVAGPVVVDNDVNWAARAERDVTGAALDDFAYLFLDEGLGCAVVADGEVLRGAGGLAGEVSHVVTTGTGGRAVAFIDSFADLGLRRPGSTAVDVAATLAAIGAERDGSAVLDGLADGICGVLAAIVALADPAVVVIGGRWGSHPRLVAHVGEAFARMPRHVPVRAGTVREQPSLAGARAESLRLLRAWVTEGGGRP